MPVPPVIAKGFGAGPGPVANWAVMSPPGSRNTSVQLPTTVAGGAVTATQEPTESPACWPLAKSWSWKMFSSPSAMGASGLSVFDSMIVCGLNTTLKMSVVDLGVLGPAGGEAAAADTVAATTASMAMTAAVKTFRDIGFL